MLSRVVSCYTRVASFCTCVVSRCVVLYSCCIALCRVFSCWVVLLLVQFSRLDHNLVITINRSSPPELLLVKDVLKICSKFTGEYPTQKCETTLQHGCFLVHLLHIFRTPFPMNTSGWLFLDQTIFSS